MRQVTWLVWLYLGLYCCIRGILPAGNRQHNKIYKTPHEQAIWSKLFGWYSALSTIVMQFALQYLLSLSHSPISMLLHPYATPICCSTYTTYMLYSLHVCYTMLHLLRYTLYYISFATSLMLHILRILTSAHVQVFTSMAVHAKKKKAVYTEGG